MRDYLGFMYLASNIRHNRRLVYPQPCANLTPTNSPGANMRLDALAKLVPYVLLFYFGVVRPRRYVQAMSKVVFLLVLFIPAVAHIGAGWKPNEHSEHENKVRGEVCAGLVVAALISSGFFVLLFDLTASWRGIVRLVASYIAVQVVLGAAVLHWFGDAVTLAHGRFLLTESPRILAIYIARLPWDGWGQLKVLGERMWVMFRETILEDTAAPTLALRRPDGRIVANITASM